MKVNNILETIGNTPHLKINNLFDNRIEVYYKLERINPGGSIKDRIALAMIEDAERKGILKEDSVIIEPTSGNTGIGLAMVAAVKKYKITIVMPETFSVERRKIMTAYGARLELTPGEKGMKGAIDRAHEMIAENPKAWMPMQFDNPANPKVHMETTAQEILSDFPEGIDFIFGGVGSGGHITGCAEALKKVFPKLKVFAIEPETSPVLSGGKPGPHALQGLGAGFIPGVMKPELLDGIITISKAEAYNYTICAARQEGLFIGISSGAVLAAIAKMLPEIKDGSKILGFNYDSGERYLSVDDLFEI